MPRYVDPPVMRCHMNQVATLDGTNDVDILFDTRNTAQNGIYTLILETLTDTVSSGMAVSVLTSYVTPSAEGYADYTETAKWTTDDSSELFLAAADVIDISTIADTVHYSITQAYVNNETTTTIIHQTGDGITVRLTGKSGDDGTIAVRLRIR